MISTLLPNEHVVLEASLGPDNIIYLTASGRLTNQHIDEFLAWSKRTRELIAAQSEVQDPPIHIYGDVSGVTHFETKIVRELRDLMNDNKKYALRTVIVGANKMTGMLIDAVVALTGRTNVKQFPARKEALQWLLEKKEA